MGSESTEDKPRGVSLGGIIELLKYNSNHAGKLTILKVSIIITSFIIVTYPFYYYEVRGGFAASGIMALTGIASLTVGSLIGFIFAIPRTVKFNNDTKKRTQVLQVNENLEQISDWLTKIIVGVGLTQIGVMPRIIQETGEYVASMSHGVITPIFVSSAIVSLVILGFLFCYLWTRLLLSPELQFADSRTSIDTEELNDQADKINNIAEYAFETEFQELRSKLYKAMG